MLQVEAIERSVKRSWPEARRGGRRVLDLNSTFTYANQADLERTTKYESPDFDQKAPRASSNRSHSMLVKLLRWVSALL